MREKFFFAAMATGIISDGHSATTIFFEPQQYFSEQDSPFIGGIVDNTGAGIYLENFEDGELNTPFVSGPTDGPSFGTTVRSRNPNPEPTRVRSVDGDDGVVDGDGFSGDAWTSISRVSFGVSQWMEFDFEPNDQGQLPLFVGLVVTPARDVDEEVELSWFDADGNTLFRDAEFDPREWAPLGGSGPGDPRVHRFIGLYHSEGIESLVLFNAEQVDHLQYGYSIPEPTSNGLLALAAGCFLLRRKRARHDQDGEEYDPSPSCRFFGS